MQKKNIFSKKAYLGLLEAFAIPLLITYRLVLFRAVIDYSIGIFLTYSKSRLIFWMIVVLFFGLGIAFTLEDRRNYAGLSFTILLPLGLYTTLAYAMYFPALICCLLVIAVVLSVLLCLWNTHRTAKLQMPPKDKASLSEKSSAVQATDKNISSATNNNISETIPCESSSLTDESNAPQAADANAFSEDKKPSDDFSLRLEGVLFSVGTVLSVCLCLLMLIVAIHLVFKLPLARSNIAAVGSDNSQHIGLTDNGSTLELLQEDCWRTLSLREKLDVLQTIANIEADQWAMPTGFTVNAAILNSMTTGQYDDEAQLITLDAGYLEASPSLSALDTLCHEAYHGYEYFLVAAYRSGSLDYADTELAEKVALYSENIDTYTGIADDGGNYEAYADQPIETDARAYGAAAAERYMQEAG